MIFLTCNEQHRNVLLYKFQVYLNDTLKTSTGDKNKIISGYPTFQLDDTTQDLGYYAPRGYFVGSDSPVYKRLDCRDVYVNLFLYYSRLGIIHPLVNPHILLNSHNQLGQTEMFPVDSLC